MKLRKELEVTFGKWGGQDSRCDSSLFWPICKSAARFPRRIESW